MKTSATIAALGLAGLLIAPHASSARALSVEVWTDRGNDAVYQPGDPILIKARTNDDAFLLVYEIDAVGSVNLLFPLAGESGAVEGRTTYRLPGGDRDELVVDQTTGQGYIVAIASTRPFDALPWYLRPVDIQAAELGYHGEPDDEEGITREGRIVGDPFVAMERIRRRVLHDANDEDGFASSYASYYVHERVRYPRYLCNDCHRPGRYAWWDGWDPYYTTCSVFDFRVNWSWGWGPRYWYGHVPYFVYVYRDDCPPHYRRYAHSGVWYSGWDGWNRWCDLWGVGGLRRYKSAPPPQYTPPALYDQEVRVRRGPPPGIIAENTRGSVPRGIGFGAGGGGSIDNDRRTRTPVGGERDRRDGVSDGRREANPDRPSRGFGVGDLRTSRDRENPRGERTSRGPDGPGNGRSRDETPSARPREERAPERPRWEPSRPQSDDRAPSREVYRAPDPPRQAPERPREVYRSPDPPRQAPDRPREVQRAPDPPRRESRAPDRPREVQRAPDPPRHEPRNSEPPRSRGNEGSRPERGNEGGRKDR